MRTGPIAYAPRPGTATRKRTATRSRPRNGKPQSSQRRDCGGSERDSAPRDRSTPSPRKIRASSHGSGIGFRFVISSDAIACSPATSRSGESVRRTSTAESARRPVTATTTHDASAPKASTMIAGAREIAAAATKIRAICHGNRPMRTSGGWGAEPPGFLVSISRRWRRCPPLGQAFASRPRR